MKKILSRYVLKEHVGPLIFALTTLTSLLLLNYVAKQFGQLVGKGLGWGVIGEFFLLSIPFTVAMTLPMAVLVSTLYAFSRLAAENEITAMKASGIGMTRVMIPVLWGASVLAVFMLFFNDQILPRANHRLRVLQGDIARKKPTFALREQVINEVQPGKLYLRAGHLDEGSNRMREIVIYDLGLPTRRRTIYADSGNMGLAPNRRDLELTLYKGYMQELDRTDPSQLQRLFYTVNHIRIPNVANTFDKSADDDFKSDRERSICDMQQLYDQAARDQSQAEREVEWALVAGTREATGRPVPPEPRQPPPGSVRPRLTIGNLYCRVLDLLGAPREVSAAEVPAWEPQSVQQSAQQPVQQPVQQVQQVQKPVKKAAKPPLKQGAEQPDRQPSANPAIARMDSLRMAKLHHRPFLRLGPGKPAEPGAGGAPATPGAPAGAPAPAAAGAPIGAVPPGQTIGGRPAPAMSLDGSARYLAVLDGARARVDDSESTLDTYGVEIEKKFALAVACIVFVLLGAPIALRFPRGGVGLVIGVSLVVFAIYYVGLIAGESVANRGYLSPFWAMWAANILFTAVGLVLLSRMGKEGNTARGGDMGEFFQNMKSGIAKLLRRVGLRAERRRSA